MGIGCLNLGKAGMRSMDKSFSLVFCLADSIASSWARYIIFYQSLRLLFTYLPSLVTCVGNASTLDSQKPSSYFLQPPCVCEFGNV